MMEGVARNYLKCEKNSFPLKICKKLIRIATTMFLAKPPTLGEISTKVCQKRWNAYESEAVDDWIYASRRLHS